MMRASAIAPEWRKPSRMSAGTSGGLGLPRARRRGSSGLREALRASGWGSGCPRRRRRTGPWVPPRGRRRTRRRRRRPRSGPRRWRPWSATCPAGDARSRRTRGDLLGVRWAAVGLCPLDAGHRRLQLTEDDHPLGGGVLGVAGGEGDEAFGGPALRVAGDGRGHLRRARLHDLAVGDLVDVLLLPGVDEDLVAAAEFA